MTGKGAFLAGLAVGATGGLLMRRAWRPRRMPHLDISQRVLAESRGEVRGAMVAARVQAGYDELLARRPHFQQRALRQHLELSILPGLALYETLRAENDDHESVMAEIDRHFSAWGGAFGRTQTGAAPGASA